MFREWGFLLTEIWVLLLLAALIGLLAGWIIWGRREVEVGNNTQLHLDLDHCRSAGEQKDRQIAALQADLDAARAAQAEYDSRSEPAAAMAAVGAGLAADASNAADDTAEVVYTTADDAGSALSAAEERAEFVGSDAASDITSTTDSADHVTADAIPDYDGDGVFEGADEGVKPETLDAARDGIPDDLKKIKGIGPKLEKLCNSLGFWHFDQIANWTSDEVAWVNANLDGFKGRVTRDNWVEQAKVLAAGGETEFSNRVDKGQVY